MSSHHINFTKSEIERIKLPSQGKRDYYYDNNEKGLVLQVTSAGSKTFYLYKKVDGRPERIKLGAYPDISIENARKKAAQNKGKIANGVNPQDEKREIRAEMTVKELFDMYMNRYSKVHKKSWKYDEREITRFLKPWFSRRISTITNQEVRRLHDKIHNENGLYQANRILERTRALYNKAIEWGYKADNPTKGIKKIKEKSRDRFIQPDEMRRFLEAVEKEENETAKDFFKILLFVGQRKTNTLMMRWDQIDFQLMVWRIPETKNGESVVIPLSLPAASVLKTRKENSPEDNPWVFPGEGRDGYYNDPKKAWARIVKSTGLKDLRMHDIRRTFGSYQAITGSSLQIIGKSLGHKSQDATQVYARLYTDPIRASIEKATAAMFELGKKNA